MVCSIKKMTVLSLCIIIAMTACAPPVQEREFKPATPNRGPRGQDVELNLRLKSFSQPRNLQWKGLVQTSQFFDSVQDLIVLSELQQKPELQHKALSWLRHFYLQPRTSQLTDFSDTPFTNLAAAQTQAEVQNALQGVNRDLQRAKSILRRSIETLGTDYLWPLEPVPLSQAIGHAENYIKLILATLPELNIDPLIWQGVREELVLQTKPLFQDVNNFITELDNAQTLSQTLQALEQAIQYFEIELPLELQKSFSQGQHLAQLLDKLTDSQDGLTLIIEVWKILTPEERATNFKPLNEELYDFLSKQTDRELACLAQRNCSGGIFKGIAKKLFILPKISGYGVEKLQADMNSKIKEFVVQQLRLFTLGFLRTIPGNLAGKVEQGLNAKTKDLNKIQDNYPSFLKQLMSAWAKKVLPDTQGLIYGLESSEIQIEISHQKEFSLSAQGRTSTMDGRLLGSSLSARSLLMKHTPPEESEDKDLGFITALSQINRLLSIGGYRDSKNKLIPALLQPVKVEAQPLDILNFSFDNSAYRIPDSLKMRDSFHLETNSVFERNFSASTLASQIRGLSSMLRLTADWKQTRFDSLLGGISAQALTEDIRADALNRGLFPKDLIFALNLGEVGILLQSITTPQTPLFLLSLDKKIVWGDGYTSSPETIIMAGVVDYAKGLRSTTVKSHDVAEFLLAIQDFLQATEGVEKTKVALLLEPKQDGQRPLDTVIQARQDLKPLLLALANFISHEMTDSSSLISSQYSLESLKVEKSPALVEDQVAAIQALLTTWEATQIDAYLWSAQDIYFAMNRELFDPNENFYVNSDRSSLDFPQKVKTLLALSRLKKHLPKASHDQLEKILTPWLKALEDLK